MEDERAVLVADPEDIAILSRFRGCLLGGAVGDALGAPVEFMSRDEILSRFGPNGITGYEPAYGRQGAITDDTQMTLFTAEGLLRAFVRQRSKGIPNFAFEGVTANAYLRWLLTQGHNNHFNLSAGEDDGWLIQQPDLWNRRAPGNTCLSALEDMKELGQPAKNDSKGCGGVMRVAPVGLFVWRYGITYNSNPSIDVRSEIEQADDDRVDLRDRAAFELGSNLAGLTHGHPTGQLSAGVLAVMIRSLLDDATLTDALGRAKFFLREAPDHEETLEAINLAEELANSGIESEQAIPQLGEGWVAEEALAISIYSAITAKDFRHGVLQAVNHDGDSDSTGAITGNLLGTMWAEQAIPTEWQDKLELRDVIAELADDMYGLMDVKFGDYVPEDKSNYWVWDKYPGG